MNIFNIERSFKDKAIRKWPKLFWAIDVHDVILEGKYKLNNDGAEYMPNALKVLRMLSNRKDDTALILWTSGHKGPTSDVLSKLEKEGVKFDYVNSNPECPDDHLCDFSRKFYFNVLLEDKAGFEGKTDWFIIEQELRRIGEWRE